MNELKPKIQLHAPASLKRNVMERIAKKAQHKRRMVALRWCSAAAIAIIGIMTIMFWPRQSVEKSSLANKQISKPTTKQPSLPIVEDRETPVPLVADRLRRDMAHGKHITSKRSKCTSHVHESTEKQNPIDVNDHSNESHLSHATHQFHQPQAPQLYTHEEQQLIDQANMHRDIIYARLVDELEQASLKQYRLRQVTYDNWQQVRQILLRIYVIDEEMKTDKPMQTI